MDIKVGEYVRTYNGLIGQVVQITNSNNYAIRIYNGAEYVVRAVIAKHSCNIIDLIEVGDIVKYQVNSLSELKVGRVKSYRNARSNKEYLGVEGFDITKIYIKSILTNKQFEENCYKVKGE